MGVPLPLPQQHLVNGLEHRQTLYNWVPIPKGYPALLVPNAITLPLPQALLLNAVEK